MTDLVTHGMNMASAFVPMTAVVPDPGSGKPPPGAEAFLDILAWTKWIALAVCVAGLMTAGATMAIQARRGEGGEHAGRIVMALIGVVVIAAATSLIGFLMQSGSSETQVEQTSGQAGE